MTIVNGLEIAPTFFNDSFIQKSLIPAIEDFDEFIGPGDDEEDGIMHGSHHGCHHHHYHHHDHDHHHHDHHDHDHAHHHEHHHHVDTKKKRIEDNIKLMRNLFACKIYQDSSRSRWEINKSIDLKTLSNKELLILLGVIYFRDSFSTHDHKYRSNAFHKIYEEAIARRIVRAELLDNKTHEEYEGFVENSLPEMLANPDEFIMAQRRNDDSFLQNVTRKRVVIVGAGLLAATAVIGSIANTVIRQNVIDGFLGTTGFLFYNIFIDNMLHIAVLLPVGLLLGSITAMILNPFRDQEKEAEIDLRGVQKYSNSYVDDSILLNEGEGKKLATKRKELLGRYKPGTAASFKEKDNYSEIIDGVIGFLSSSDLKSILRERQSVKILNRSREKLLFELLTIQELLKTRNVSGVEIKKIFRTEFNQTLINCLRLIEAYHAAKYHDHNTPEYDLPAVTKFINVFNHDGKLVGQPDPEIKQLSFFYEARYGVHSKFDKIWGVGSGHDHGDELQTFIAIAVIYIALKLIGHFAGVGIINNVLGLLESVPERILGVFELGEMWQDLGEGSPTAKHSQDVFESYNVIENAAHMPLLAMIAVGEVKSPGYTNRIYQKIGNKAGYLLSDENESREREFARA